MCVIFEFWWNSFFMGMKFNFKFQNSEKFYKGFPCNFFFLWDFFLKWAQIKITGNSFVKFSVGGPRCERTFLWERNSILNCELPTDLPTDLLTDLLTSRKKFLWFCWNLAHLKFTINKCAQFSSFGETIFLWEWNSILQRISQFFFFFSMRFLCKMSPDQN